MPSLGQGQTFLFTIVFPLIRKYKVKAKPYRKQEHSIFSNSRDVRIIV